MFTIFDNVLKDTQQGGFTSFSQFLGIALNVAMGASFSITVVALIMSGIQFVMAQGDPKQLDTARRYLTWAVIAIVLTIGAFTIKRIILGLVGSEEGQLLDVLPSL